MEPGKNITKIFKDKNYVLLNIVLALSLGFVMAIFLQFIFISPTVSVYVPEAEIIDVMFLIIFTLLSSFSITMTVYMYRKCNVPLLQKGGSGFTGTAVGVVATACTCSYVVAPLILAGGSIMSTIVAFIGAYIVPIRIISLALLGISVYLVYNNFGKACKSSNLVNYETEKKTKKKTTIRY